MFSKGIIEKKWNQKGSKQPFAAKQNILDFSLVFPLKF